MADEWQALGDWWLGEIADDPIFASDVVPLLEAALPESGGWWLDLGCGDGRVMRSLRAVTLGCDLSQQLLRRVPEGRAVRCRLPDLRWLRSDVLDGAYAVLVVEHIADLDGLLAEVIRVVRPGGHLVVVANHPAFTADGSGPVVDMTDGEVLWRWGPYFASESASIRIGAAAATVHHRPMGQILTSAAGAGWSLQMLEERPLSAAAVAAEPGYSGQETLPRLVAMRWSRPPR